MVSFSNFSRVVVKVSSSVLFDEELEGIRLSWFHSFIEDIVELHQKNIQMIIVSSGAVALGKPALPKKNFSNPTVRRALASIGQISLMAEYHSALSHYNVKSSQVLFSLKDSYDPLYSLNLADTIEVLLENGIIPVVNENDVIAPTGFSTRDNDYLSAFIAESLNADLLILLSDVKGLYDKDPKTDPSAKVIQEVKKLGEEHFLMLGSSKSIHGTGGMKSKLSATEIAVNAGCNVIIASGKKLHPLLSIESSSECTFFHRTAVKEERNNEQNRLNIEHKKGIVLNKKGLLSLTHNKDIEVEDITEIIGVFSQKELIHIYDSEKKGVGEGVATKSSEALSVLMKSLEAINANFGNMWDKRVVQATQLKYYSSISS